MSVTKIDPAVRRRLFDLAQHPRDPKKYQCAGCRRYFSLNALQVDHITPESESTPAQRTDPDNYQLLCYPKGSTRLTSCHKRKTAREAADRARRNRVPLRWGLPLLSGGSSVIVLGFTFESAFNGPQAAHDWLVWSGLSTGAVLSTYLVQNAFRRRRPRRSIPAQLVPEPGHGLDLTRIVEAAREIIGQKGSVRAIAHGSDSFTLAYPESGFADHDDDKKFELLNKIQAKLGDRWMPAWDTSQDKVRFTRRPVLERMIRHPGFEANRAWNVLPIAPGVSFDLLVTPHVLIVGTTGAGKTALMRTLIVAVADSARRTEDTQLILADPKHIEMPGFEGWSGVKRILSEDEDLWEMAFDLEEQMHERLRLIKAKKAKPSDFKRLIVVIDEYEQYFKRMDRYWKSALDEDGKPIKKGSARVPPAIDAIQSVLSMARRVNIHLIIGTQSPDANWFGGTGTRENLAGRAAVGPVDSYRARMMFDDSSVGRDIPIEFKGRATIQVGDGEPQELQVYFTPDPFDPEGENTDEDWQTLLRVGMPKELIST